MSPEQAGKVKTMSQSTFNQRVEVYEVKKVIGKRVAVRAKGVTSIGKLSIFFEMHCGGASPRVGEDILVSITTPADSTPSVSK